MPFVKIQKNNTYSKRFQVKFRRRRAGKTDYYQRKRLILQRKNKYNTPKYRFVVRRTNKRIICQIMWATIKGDKTKSYADSFELRRFGLTAGLTNYAAAYCTGLLCSRRLLALLDKENAERNKNEEAPAKMAEVFDIVKEPGEIFDFKELCEEKGIENKPFTCVLDLGLVRATNGNRVFAAVKGAVDGGIHIPHEETIFPGHGKEKEEEDDKKGKKPDKKKDSKKKETTDIFRERIFGKHVQKYMEEYAKKKDAQAHQFLEWKECMKKNGVKNLEDLYKKIHAEIRKNPLKPEKKVEKPKYTRKEDDKAIVIAPSGKEFRRDIKLNNEQRKQRVNEKIAKFLEERGKK